MTPRKGGAGGALGRSGPQSNAAEQSLRATDGSASSYRQYVDEREHVDLRQLTAASLSLIHYNSGRDLPVRQVEPQRMGPPVNLGGPACDESHRFPSRPALFKGRRRLLRILT